MDFKWTKHRFSGGLLALDLVNTVIHRRDAYRRVDRFAVPGAIVGFVEGARRFRADEVVNGECGLDAANDPGALIKLREAIDDAFRPREASGDGNQQSLDPKALHRLFAAASTVSRMSEKGNARPAFGALCAVSAMRLLDVDFRRRVKACPRCDWLFVDKSRNQSRLWCDMAVCGNRAKASAHYSRTQVSTNVVRGE